MFQKGFFFINNRSCVNKSFTFVSDDELYDTQKGYGFVNKDNYYEQELLQIPALSNGFIPLEMKTKRPVPKMFKVNVLHQGNYKVEIELVNDGSEAQIFLERRRMYYLGRFTGVKKFVFSVNVCDIIPEGKERIYQDTDLDISWIGEGLEIHNIEIKEVSCPTIYIAGDSTVTDQPADYPYSPGTSYSGWGQMLPMYLNEKVAVSNHAHSGLTTETFRKEGHYSIISQYIRPGDYFMLQFGHNDQKIEELREDTGYRDNIIRFITEIQSQGATPIIVTPLARNTWKKEAKEYNDFLEKYALECIKIGEEQNVSVLDLHNLSMELIKKNGMEESRKYFHPGDYTHTNDYGAFVMASFVTSELRKVAQTSKIAAIKQISSYIKESVDEWNIEKDKLIMPILLGDNEEKKEEPYELAMDRLEEIIRRK